jgi:hypothetical protein
MFQEKTMLQQMDYQGDRSEDDPEELDDVEEWIDNAYSFRVSHLNENRSSVNRDLPQQFRV